MVIFYNLLYDNILLKIDVIKVNQTAKDLQFMIFLKLPILWETIYSQICDLRPLEKRLISDERPL